MMQAKDDANVKPSVSYGDSGNIDPEPLMTPPIIPFGQGLDPETSPVKNRLEV